MAHHTPYTAKSFVSIAERDDRRGRAIGRLDASVSLAIQRLKKRRKQYLKAVDGLAAADPVRVQLRTDYRIDRDQLRRDRDEAVLSFVESVLEQLEEKLTSPPFVYGLHAGPVVGGKQTFDIERSAVVRFAVKEAALRLRVLADAEPPSRNSTIRALKNALKKPYAHTVLKIDIGSFFESIPHDKLLEKIARLDGVSFELVESLLGEFKAITGEAKGVPRGVGLSSQLAEVYLAGLDVALVGQPGVLFYSRYVDDIVVVCESDAVRDQVNDQLDDHLSTLGLSKNSGKTKSVSADKKGDYPGDETIEYLGYSFRRSGGSLTTGLTDKRRSRRRARLALAFEHWDKTLPNAKWPNHGINGLLVDRVRFLAGNTRLANAKSNVAVGMFFSNSALDADSVELSQLDDDLDELIAEHGSKMPGKLRRRLEDISFAEWFRQKKFLRFKQTRMKQIVAVWEAGKS